MCKKDSLISSELSCKSTWKPGTLIYPLPAALISCGNGNEINIMTVSWLGTICTNPPMCYISVRPERHSYDLIKKNGCFVINLTNEEMAFATDWCGVKSGKDINKFKEMNLTPLKAQVVDAPIIKESPLSIECEVVEIKELGSHHMFIANVVAVEVDDKYMDEKQSFNLALAEPIVYSHGEYYQMGQKLGKFGYSVQKKRSKKSLYRKKT